MNVIVEDIAVSVRCQLDGKTRNVYFNRIGSACAFNGCDEWFHACAECRQCKSIAAEELTRYRSDVSVVDI